MQIILYKTLDSVNTINKILNDGLTIDINLKSETDLTNPRITLANVEGLNNRRFNYLHIPELGKYYFIDNITSVNNDISLLHCSTDLLMTYKDEILASNARFKRNIKTGDYLEFNNDNEIFKTVTIVNSDVSLIGDESSKILTTIGL